MPGGAFAEAQLTKILVNVCIGIGAAVVGWAVSSAISGNWDADELRSALANAIFFTGVTVFISTSVSTLKYVGREPYAAADLAECAGNCFIAGTLVATADGLKPIEDIEVGDEVLAYDPETGEQAYKPVVRLFRNETDKWYHVHVNEQDITCTAEHPFYVADIDEFVPAKDLKAGQSLLLADGSCAEIDGILVEELSAPEATYNFEVEDYHTYYVSEDKVLVHNMCETERVGRWMSEKEYNAMTSTGYVQESYSGTTHVARPANPNAFIKQAKVGSYYVEFDVPASSLVNSGNGWARILGPHSIDAKLAILRNQPIPQMPKATNIVLVRVK